MPASASRPGGSTREGWREMRKLTTVTGLVLILALGPVTTVGRPQPARAADGDNLVLV